MLTTILFIIGFVLLIKGADLLVDGSSSLASRARISPIVIGLTIVAFGTSAPEFVVNIIAVSSGNTDIAIGNILGSNIANILLILGISAVIYPVIALKNTIWKEIPLCLLASVLVGVLANDALIDGSATSQISRIDGLVLLSFFIIFLYYTFGIAKLSNEGYELKSEVVSYSKSFSYIGLGLVMLIFGGKWIVTGAVEFATAFGISQSLIGLTIVAIGTSLPELATSAIAAYKKQADIAIGNVVGSNIFNVFWILGASAVIRPLPFHESSQTDILMTILAGLILFLAMFTGKRHMVERWQGILMILLYICYIAYLVVSQ